MGDLLGTPNGGDTVTEQEWLTISDPIAMRNFLLNTPAHLNVNGRPWSEWKPRDRKLQLAAEAIWSLRFCTLGKKEADLMHLARCVKDTPNRSFIPAFVHILRDIVGNPFQPVTLPLGEPCPVYVTGREVWCSAYHKPSPVLTPLVLQLAEAAYTVRTGTGTLDNDALAVLSDALEEAGLPERVTCERCSGSGALTVEATPNSISYWQGNVTTELGCGYCGGESVENGRNGSGRQPNPILAHLREPGPHYRGCWATDILLGKE